MSVLQENPPFPVCTQLLSGVAVSQVRVAGGKVTEKVVVGG